MSGFAGDRGVGGAISVVVGDLGVLGTPEAGEDHSGLGVLKGREDLQAFEEALHLYFRAGVDRLLAVAVDGFDALHGRWWPVFAGSV